MDLKQRKLSKSEWESIEISVSESENEILKLIISGFHNVHIKLNKTSSIFTFLKIEYNPQIEEFLYVKYFADKIKKLISDTKTNFIYFNTSKKTSDFKNNEYNNFIYSGDYWISREQILSMDKEIIDICDDILFKGKSHQKRYIGITMVTKKIFVHWNYDLIPLKNKIRLLFLKIYNNTKTISSITDITNITNITNNSLEKVEEIEQEAAEEEEIQVISKKRKISNL